MWRSSSTSTPGSSLAGKRPDHCARTSRSTHWKWPCSTVAAAMIDRIVHHADVLTLKGASYWLRNRGIDTLPSIRVTADDPDN